MKKSRILLLSVLTLLLVPVISLFAQGPDEPSGLFQWVGALPTYLGTFWGVAVSLPFLVAIVIGLLKLTDGGKAGKYVVTGLVALTLLLLSYFLNFGYLNGSDWWWIIPNWIGLMVIEILGYSIPVIKAVLDAIAEKFNPWPT